MNYLEFSQKVKAKYPDYADIDDLELAKKMVAKFPDEYSDVTFEKAAPEQQQQSQPEPTPFTRMGEAATRFREAEQDPSLPMPVKAGAGLAYIGEQLGNVAGVPLHYIGKGFGKAMEATGIPQAAMAGGEKLAQATRGLNPTVLGAHKATLGNIGRAYESLPEGSQAGLRGAVDIAGVIPVGAGARLAAGGAMKATGGATAALGKKLLVAEMKPKEALIKQGYGRNLAEKQKILLNNVEKYDIATAGNFEKMADRAITKAEQRFAQTNEIAKKIAPDNTVNPVQTMKEAAEEIKAPAGWADKKASIVNGIIDDMNKRGWNTEMPLDEYISAKRMLDPDGRLFKEGPGLSDADNFERSIRKAMYLKMVDKISEKSPEIAKLNREAKELLDIHAITQHAGFAAGKRNIASLTDFIALAGGAGSAAVRGADPGMIAIYGILGLTVKKLGSQGRAAGVLIKAGKELKRGGEQLAPTDALRIQKPTIGGIGRVISKEEQNRMFPTKMSLSEIGEANRKTGEAGAVSLGKISKADDAEYNKLINTYRGFKEIADNQSYPQSTRELYHQGLINIAKDMNKIQKKYKLR